MTTLILTYIALLPPLFLMWLIYKQDLVEHEPLGLVLQTFFLGCIVPVPVLILTIPVEFIITTICGGLASILADESFFGIIVFVYELALYFIQVALLEEGGKWFMLRLRIWNHKEFNYRFDAIVYSVAVSIGFAAIENLMYVFNHGFSVGLLRAVTAIPAHTIFAIFMGYYMGEAKYHAITKNNNLARKCKINALLVPILIHGAYDFIATRESTFSSILFWVFLGIMDIMAIGKVIGYAKKDKALIPESDYVHRPYSSDPFEEFREEETPDSPYRPVTSFTEIEKLLEEMERQRQKDN